MLDERTEAFGFFARHLRERHHDEPVADLALVGRSSIKTADVASALAGDGVGFKAVTVLDVGAQNLLVRKNPYSLHVVGI